MCFERGLLKDKNIVNRKSTDLIAMKAEILLINTLKRSTLLKITRIFSIYIGADFPKGGYKFSAQR